MSKPIKFGQRTRRVRELYLAPSKNLHRNHITDGSHVTNLYKSSRRAFVAGCDLFRAGESGEAIYGLVDGWVALYHLLVDGRRQILHIALPGAILAFAPRPGAVMDYSAQALTNVVVSTVGHESFWQSINMSSDAGIEIAAVIQQDRSIAYDHLCSIGRRSARTRVAHLLLELFIRSRLRSPDRLIEEIDIPLTQEDIGDATGLTGVHVNRVLRGLQADGIAEFHYRHLRILNPAKFNRCAGVDHRLARAWIKSELSKDLVMDCREERLAGPAIFNRGRRQDVQPAAHGRHPV